MPDLLPPGLHVEAGLVLALPELVSGDVPLRAAVAGAVVGDGAGGHAQRHLVVVDRVGVLGVGVGPGLAGGGGGQVSLASPGLPLPLPVAAVLLLLRPRVSLHGPLALHHVRLDVHVGQVRRLVLGGRVAVHVSGEACGNTRVKFDFREREMWRGGEVVILERLLDYLSCNFRLVPPPPPVHHFNFNLNSNSQPANSPEYFVWRMLSSPYFYRQANKVCKEFRFPSNFDEV